MDLGNSLTFTQIGDCRSSCPSPESQSLLEFDYWTGEIVTSPFWQVIARPNHGDYDNSNIVKVFKVVKNLLLLL